MTRSICLILIAMLLTGGSAAASPTPRTLSWDDLVPQDAQYPEDPLSRLTGPQQEDVGFILRASRVKARTGRGEDSDLAIEIAARKDKLRSEGVDVDELVARVREVEAAWRDSDEKVEPSLNRQHIRLPGYVLPLEFSGSKVVEFLLVPFVGACLHVPPPPPNQIVYVRSVEGIDVSGLYTPVYVTGYMRTRGSTKKSVFLTDGNVDVSYGYSMLAVKVEVYREEARP